MRIDTVIFDIGGVLTVYRAGAFWLDRGYDGQTAARLARATTDSPQWNEYDRGGLTEDEVIGLFCANDPEMSDIIRKEMPDLSGLVQRSDAARPWIRRLKESGRRVLYLSNYSAPAVRDCAEALDFIPDTDGGILSYLEQTIKPEPRIYELLISRYGLVPEK